jgi:predicted nucleic acid-binding protein
VIALLDNTVLSNFSVVERADLVRRALGEDAATTQAVWDELQTGVRMSRLPAQDWSWLQILSLTEDEREVYDLLTRRLNAVERL